DNVSYNNEIINENVASKKNSVSSENYISLKEVDKIDQLSHFSQYRIESNRSNQSADEQLTNLLTFINDNVSESYRKNSSYTYQLTHGMVTYNMPWSVMKAYDPVSAKNYSGGYNQKTVIEGLQKDLDSNGDIAQKITTAAGSYLKNNKMSGVTDAFAKALANNDVFNRAIEDHIAKKTGQINIGVCEDFKSERMKKDSGISLELN
ncbi:hypothetical protein, partial [Cysteiniphilum litorale]|uniref:hypothetical protein n=1 Tax=Cysteiniphilum litorale TaxID=2056700 RepID=UPI003F885D5B